MKDVPKDKRRAYFICTVHFIDENGRETAAEGRVYGEIGYEPRGGNGFGYDPVFMRDGKSFAEIGAEEKNAVSHRKNALDELMKKLTEK